MGASERVANWIVDKLRDDQNLKVEHVGSGFLQVARNRGASFIAAAVGVDDVVREEHVSSLFLLNQHNPEFVVNVPTKAIWTGGAIDLIHNAPAAFGSLGDLVRASQNTPASAYRNKQYAYFEQAFHQHRAITGVRRL